MGSKFTPEQLALLSPAGFAWYASRGKWFCPPHLQHLNSKLMDVAAGRCKRLIVTMPPRHGKSEFISKYFPAWFLGLHPDDRIILTSYESSFAASWGRKARDLLAEFHGLFGIKIDQGSASVQDWNIFKRMGGMNTAGAGSSITGRGAKVLIVDDPLKNAEEASSEVIREKIKEWYKSTAYTRLEPDGAIIIIMCMTGDTPVLMADGSETMMCDIKVGDKISTYDNGKLTVSTVKNHINNGNDIVFKIKTINGRIVKANERHPFLVDDNGELKWIRLKNLNTAHKIVTLKGNGGNGKGKSVLLMGAKNQQKQGDTARHTTARKSGLMDINRHLITQKHGVREELRIDTVSLQQNTIKCMKRRTENASFVSNPPPLTCVPIGTESYVLTMTTSPAKSGACCATIATSQLDIANQKKQHYPSQNTSDFTTEGIVSIEFAGIEEVFDIQVEGTENFIANGLVSHNTRWHDDDLVGWLLSEQKKGGEVWDVVDFPAIATHDDILGRKPSEALWPDRFPVKELARIKKGVGSFWFAAMYQQNPVPAGGAIIKREWWKYYATMPDKKAFKRYIWAWDTAVKVGEENDYSVGIYLGETEAGYYVLDVKREKLEYPDLKRAIVQYYQGRRASAIVMEDKSSGQQVIQELQRGSRLPVVAVEPVADKVTRAYLVTPLIEAGLVYLPENSSWVAEFIDECLKFPKGKHDDQVDALVYGLDYLKNQNHHGLDSFLLGGAREASKYS